MKKLNKLLYFLCYKDLGPKKLHYDHNDSKIKFQYLIASFSFHSNEKTINFKSQLESTCKTILSFIKKYHKFDK